MGCHAKTSIVTGYDPVQNRYRIITHLMIDHSSYGDYDPSYETQAMQEKKYYGSPREFYRTDKKTNSLTFQQKLQIENEYNTMKCHAFKLNQMPRFDGDEANRPQAIRTYLEDAESPISVKHSP